MRLNYLLDNKSLVQDLYLSQQQSRLIYAMVHKSRPSKCSNARILRYGHRFRVNPKLSTAARIIRRKLKSSSQPTTPALSPSPPPLPFTRLSSSTLTNLSAVTWISHIPHIPHNDRRPPLPRPARNPDRRIPEIDHSFPEGSCPEGAERLCFRQRCQGDGRP